MTLFPLAAYWESVRKVVWNQDTNSHWISPRTVSTDITSAHAHRSWHGTQRIRVTNLLISIHALHLRDDDIIDVVLASERRHVLHLLIYHALILRQVVTGSAVPVHAEAIECVFAFGGRQEFGHPLRPLIDAGLVL